MLIILFFYENDQKNIFASSQFIIAFFIQLHIVKIRETKNVKNMTKRRKMSFLLNNCLNI